MNNPFHFIGIQGIYAVNRLLIQNTSTLTSQISHTIYTIPLTLRANSLHSNAMYTFLPPTYSGKAIQHQINNHRKKDVQMQWTTSISKSKINKSKQNKQKSNKN